MKNQIPQIGSSFPRNDAAAKVIGAEKYATDYYPGNLLWAGVKRAGMPHGRIKQIDISDARKIPGVYAVLTRKDVPGTNRQGPVHKDQPVLAGKKVRHCGDPIALVLCENRDTLEKALSQIRADIDPLPGVFDMDAALQKNSPLIHEEHGNGNILSNLVIEQGKGGKGKGEKGIDECDFTAQEFFQVPMQEHAFLETENGVAWQDPGGRIVIVASTQAPHEDQDEVSYALGMKPDQIRVISPYPGGGFGGKEGATVQCLLALAALHSQGRPVKMWWSREESFAAGYKRHPARLHYWLGAMKDGTLHALHCRLYYDTGAYAHFGEEVMTAGMEHAGGPYRIPNTFVQGWCIYTNNPISGAMRGFGVTQANFAMERMMDILASKLGIDPLKFRLKNALTRGDKNPAGITLTHSTGIRDCFEQIRHHPLWINREKWKSRAGLFKQRGTGIAGMLHSAGYGKGLPDGAIAKAEITKHGCIRIYSGIPDMGQGNAATLLQIAGEELCQEASGMELIQPDTDKTLPSGSSSACRTTYTYGNALIKSCRDLKKRLIHRAALIMLADSEDGLALVPGKVRHLLTGEEVSLKVIAGMMQAAERISVCNYLMPVAKDMPDTGKDFPPGFPHILFSYAAHLVYVEIDELTGCIEIKKYLAVTDAGRILNPQIYEQQIHGAVAQGIGYALTEELLLEKGQILNPNFADYYIPCALDIPDMDSLSVETTEHSGPYGMKGIGQIGIDGPLPAMANAVKDACGAEISQAPITGQYILNKLQQ